MRIALLAMTALALAGCNKTTTAGETTENVVSQTVRTTGNVADTTMNGIAPSAARTTLNETSWEFKDPATGKPMQESIDATGKYITVSGKAHIDHGTSATKDGKLCFTSLMNKDGESCWTDPMLAIGSSGETTNDKGEKLTVKRVEYVPLKM